MIRDLLAKIEKYCSRNQLKKDEKLEAERRKQHEAQHAAQLKDSTEEQGFTAGGNQRVVSQSSIEEEEKEVDPSIQHSLDDVYTDEPEMKTEDDPFKKVPVMDDHNKPASLYEMEKSMDAVVEYSEHGADSSLERVGSDDEMTSLDQGTRGLPDIIGNQGNTPPPDVTGPPQGAHPPDLASRAAVDLLEDATESPSTQPVDLTDGLGQP